MFPKKKKNWAWISASTGKNYKINLGKSYGRDARYCVSFFYPILLIQYQLLRPLYYIWVNPFHNEKVICSFSFVLVVLPGSGAGNTC
ncbi:DUF4014 family protein [uncultured Mucilaginibacter sp.]|uniref:DUF4014 family protein n=1 Tax=Mucilaginibacter sp. 44-25 TaxID=1895794 RepID=UPI00342573D2